MHTWALAYLAFEWLLRFVMLVYVPQRRSPAAARTWLLLIFIQPVVGVILYSLFGRPYLSRHRQELQARVMKLLETHGPRSYGQHAMRPDVPPQFQQAVVLAERLGEFPIVRGNELELLDDYETSIDRLIADIDAAQKHVHLLYYIFADDRTGHRVAEALIRASARGVDCCLLIDSLASKGARRALAPRLREAGIEVRELLPVRLFRRNAARLDLRNHRKIAIIDSALAYVGSQNIVDADFKKGLVYEELVARLTGPAVLQLQAVFLSDRYFETETSAQAARFFPTSGAAGESLAQVLPSGPGFRLANNQRLVVALLHAARRRVVITTPYFVPDESLLQALQTAVLRGVEVHLILPEQADQFLVCLAQRSFYDELLEAGVRIHQYTRRFLHAKHLSFDETAAIVGSSNLDIRSFLLNAEISLIVYDPKFVARLRAIQDRYLADSNELSLARWRTRPWLTRVSQNTARLVDSLV